MQKESAVHPKLSLDQANTLCREFLPIGEAVFDYVDRLQRAGFSAFVPHHDFIQSFCSSEEESDIHKRCLIESAKNLLGRPWPWSLSVGPAEKQLLYQSPFIQRLSQERDTENGFPVSELPNRCPEQIWRIEIDPCQRRKAFNKINDRLAFDARWAAVQKEQRRRLESEAEHHATGLASNYKFHMQQRYAFFTAVMKKDAAALGFEFDHLKSRSYFPVFSKPISEEWDICWVLEEPKSFCFNFVSGRFTPYLEIRSRNLIGSFEKRKVGEFLFIRHYMIVPGFFNAYGKFFKLEELETMIKAHLCLYSLMAPIIEMSAKRTLGGVVTRRPEGSVH
jgi:hypothetical protein